MARKSVDLHGFALREHERCENLITIGCSNIAVLGTSRFLEFFGKLGAVRILKAGAQSFSSGVGSFCGYPSQTR